MAMAIAKKSSKSSPGTEDNPTKDGEGDDHPVSIDDTFNNRYTAIRKLGSGHFSTVWLCRDLQDQDTSVAVKILKSCITKEETENEITMLKHVQYCDIDGFYGTKFVQLLDNFTISGVNGTHTCMVFELLGDSLLELIQRSNYEGIPLSDVKIIIKHVLQALDYFHTTCGIIHTDIKPENVCVNFTVDESSEKRTRELSATVTDFGNACWIEHHFARRIQTCEYRSPEVILEAGYDENADVWSTACMAFELATGNYLFDPRAGERYSRDWDHLAKITDLLGNVPKDVALSGARCAEFFTAEGKIRQFRKLKSGSLVKLLTRKYRWGEREAGRFARFLGPMLAVDPKERCSANDCLSHRWLE